MFLFGVLMAVYCVTAACVIVYLNKQADKDKAKKPWEEE